MNVAINGFGRIGRLTFKALLSKKDINIVAINDLTDIPSLAHLLKYDSTQGKFEGSIAHDDEHLIVNDKKIKITSERNPANLPWKELNVDIALESTGLFTQKEDAEQHIQAGAKKVVISAPAKGEVPTVVLGVNDNILTGEETVISNASCTTNCLAPILKVLDEHFDVESGYMSTVHAYTSDQNILDAPHKKDLRRARSAAYSIIPTSTGAAKAVGKVIPHLEGKIKGMAMRVPIPDGSLVDLTCLVKKEVSIELINSVVKTAAEKELKGIVEYTTDPIVSIDIIGNPHSSIFDSSLTDVNGQLIKIITWYDNEAGYAHRSADLIEKLTQYIK